MIFEPTAHTQDLTGVPASWIYHLYAPTCKKFAMVGPIPDIGGRNPLHKPEISGNTTLVELWKASCLQSWMSGPNG